MRRWSLALVPLWLAACPPSEPEPEHTGTPTETGSTTDLVWTDDATGLTWELEAAPPVDWAAAGSRCDGLTLAGHDDWRLPTISELRSLIVGCPATEVGGTCGVTDTCADGSSCRGDACGGCGYTPGSCYWPAGLTGDCAFTWSSTLDSNDPDQAWGVGFDGAHVSQGLLVNSSSVRCVR